MITYKTAVIKKIRNLDNLMSSLDLYDYLVYKDPKEKIIGVILITNKFHVGITENIYKGYLVQTLYYLRGEKIVLQDDWKDFKLEFKLRFPETKRTLEKEASRIQDEEDLLSGKKTREELKKENGLFHGIKCRLDLKSLENLK